MIKIHTSIGGRPFTIVVSQEVTKMFETSKSIMKFSDEKLRVELAQARKELTTKEAVAVSTLNIDLVSLREFIERLEDELMERMRRATAAPVG